MRIAVVHSFYSSAVPSGENVIVSDQIDLLRRAGHTVEVIARHTDEESAKRFYGVRAAITVATGRGSSPASALRAFAPDVVHLHNTFPNFGTSWLDEFSSRLVVTLHNYRTVCSNGLLFRDGAECRLCLDTPFRPAMRFNCYRDSALATLPVALATRPNGSLARIPRVAKRLVALNDTAAEILSSHFGRPVDLVPNFVDAASTTEPVKEPSGWLFVGRLSPEKGIGLLAGQWPRGVPLDIVGSGPLTEEVAAAALLNPQIRLLGQIPRDELLSRMPGYVGLVIPSVWGEGLPTVILEALAHGLPILVSHSVDASRPMIEAGAAVGFTPRSFDPSVLDAIVERRSEMSQAALNLHRRVYSPDAWLREIQRIYGEVVEDPAASG